MNTTEITESQITEWMLARLAKVKEITPRGAISFELKADNFNPDIHRRATFRIYNDIAGHSDECGTVADAMESFRIKAGKFSPSEKARRNREHAARLLAEADALESATL